MPSSSFDSVRAIGCETPAEGGTQSYTSPTEIDPKSDALALAAVHLIGPAAASGNDKSVFVDRTAGGLRLTDNVTQRLLSELVTSVTSGSNSHAAIRDIQHFLAGEGPGDGFASGAVMARSYSGPLMTQETWYTSSTFSTKIVQRVFSYVAGSPLPSSCTWTLYSAAGAPMRTLVCTYQYSGALQNFETRTWS